MKLQAIVKKSGKNIRNVWDLIGEMLTNKARTRDGLTRVRSAMLVLLAF